MKAIPGRTSGFLVLVGLVLGVNIYGEPYSTGTLPAAPGYTGRYLVVFLLSLGYCYSLYTGVQLPRGAWVSYGRGYILVSVWCTTGYTTVYMHEGSYLLAPGIYTLVPGVFPNV